MSRSESSCWFNFTFRDQSSQQARALERNFPRKKLPSHSGWQNLPVEDADVANASQEKNYDEREVSSASDRSHIPKRELWIRHCIHRPRSQES